MERWVAGVRSVSWKRGIFTPARPGVTKSVLVREGLLLPPKMLTCKAVRSEVLFLNQDLPEAKTSHTPTKCIFWHCCQWRVSFN